MTSAFTDPVTGAAQICAGCVAPLPAGSRRDRLYCTPGCARATHRRCRKAGLPLPQRPSHPSADTDDPVLRAADAALHELAEQGGWTDTTVRNVRDGLVIVLTGCAPGTRLSTSGLAAVELPRRISRSRILQVLTSIDALDDDRVPTIRTYVATRTAEFPPGFADPVRAWLLALLDGEPRARPRSTTTVYGFFNAIVPLLHRWTTGHGHLREVTGADAQAALQPLTGDRLHTALAATRSLFRTAKRHKHVFTDPTTRLHARRHPVADMPLTSREILAAQQAATTPALRLAIALAAVHGASTGTIRRLRLEHVDRNAGRITLDGVRQPLDNALVDRALTAWLAHRKATWPRTTYPHVLVNRRTFMGTDPVSCNFIRPLQAGGITLGRIRRDRISTKLWQREPTRCT